MIEFDEVIEMTEEEEPVLTEEEAGWKCDIQPACTERNIPHYSA